MTGGDPDGLRVALLTPRYYPEVQRGTERTVRDLATALAGWGHKLRVITSHPGAPSSREEDATAATVGGGDPLPGRSGTFPPAPTACWMESMACRVTCSVKARSSDSAG